VVIEEPILMVSNPFAGSGTAMVFAIVTHCAAFCKKASVKLAIFRFSPSVLL